MSASATAEQATRLLVRTGLSPYIPLRPLPAQLELLLASEAEALYSGTGASGKSTALLMAALMHVDQGGWSAALVVPVRAGHRLVGLAREWLGDTEARWDAGGQRWVFPSGATVAIAHRRAQLGGHQLIGVDDLAVFEREEYLALFKSLRADPGVPVRPVMRAASSPDAPGREWIGQRFGLAGEAGVPVGRSVVRATFEDNLGVDAESVRRALSELPEPRRSWLLAGDWNAGAGTGAGDSPAPAGPDSRGASPQSDGDRPRARLGTDPEGREVSLDPWLPGAELPNPHLLVTGETGSGKTQSIQALVAELQRWASPLVLDFKDDYVGEWAGARGLLVTDPGRGADRLPFNPLAPPVDRRSGEANALFQAHLVGDLLKRVWGLGDQQAFRLREAIKAAYAAHGIPVGPFRPDSRSVYPTFAEVHRRLEPGDTLEGRLSPLFDLDPFSATADGEGLAEMLGRGTVVRLALLPGSEAKATVAEFLLLALYDRLARQGHPDRMRWLLVLDEGWRLAACPFLEPLLREGRSLGLGVMLATQFPRDLPLEIKGCAATHLHFGQTQLEQVGEIQRSVLGATQGQEARRLAQALRGLTRFHTVLHARGEWEVVRVMPWFERGQDLPGESDGGPLR